jgi:folylpolyglutamate synthase/dihydropteroate synthase
MVLGVSADKDLVGIIEPLRDRIVGAIATQSAHPRAMPAAKLQGRLATLGVQAESEPDPIHAVRYAMDQRVSDAVILICGSVFLVEQVAASIAAIEKL